MPIDTDMQRRTIPEGVAGTPLSGILAGRLGVPDAPGDTSPVEATVDETVRRLDAMFAPTGGNSSDGSASNRRKTL